MIPRPALFYQRAGSALVINHDYLSAVFPDGMRQFY